MRPRKLLIISSHLLNDLSSHYVKKREREKGPLLYEDKLSAESMQCYKRKQSEWMKQAGEDLLPSTRFSVNLTEVQRCYGAQILRDWETWLFRHWGSKHPGTYRLRYSRGLRKWGTEGLGYWGSNTLRHLGIDVLRCKVTEGYRYRGIRELSKSGTEGRRYSDTVRLKNRSTDVPKDEELWIWGTEGLRK